MTWFSLKPTRPRTGLAYLALTTGNMLGQLLEGSASTLMRHTAPHAGAFGGVYRFCAAGYRKSTFLCAARDAPVVFGYLSLREVRCLLYLNKCRSSKPACGTTNDIDDARQQIGQIPIPIGCGSTTDGFFTAG